jgi:uncharacterized protein YbgA (DUF1722 family)
LELLGLIEETQQGLVPLIVPLTLLKHHLNRHPVPDWVLVPSAAWVLVPSAAWVLVPSAAWVLVPSAAWVLVPSAAWVHQQVYLHPYPKELMLRNHV